MELLRDESFQLRDGDPAFRLIVHTVDNPYYTSRTTLGYRLLHGSMELFAGSDFGCSPLHAIDSDVTLLTILSFLCMKPGDTDSDYFAGYTDSQLMFCQEYADDLMFVGASRFPSAGQHLGYEVEDLELDKAA
jgi:hypothetical protein